MWANTQLLSKISHLQLYLLGRPQMFHRQGHEEGMLDAYNNRFLCPIPPGLMTCSYAFLRTQHLFPKSKTNNTLFINDKVRFLCTI